MNEDHAHTQGKELLWTLLHLFDLLDIVAMGKPVQSSITGDPTHDTTRNNFAAIVSLQ